MKERIIRYLIDKYDPDAIITYGSYSDGSFNAHSDFDALVIADSPTAHDGSVIDGVALDVFIYSPQLFAGEYDEEKFSHIYDGIIELDKTGIAERLKKNAEQYISGIPFKTREEIQHETQWCRKMLLRAERGDAEGYFRWHWLLTDGLEFYCDIVKKRYRGPKKTLKQMAEDDSRAFELYEKALKDFTHDALAEWVGYLEETASSVER